MNQIKLAGIRKIFVGISVSAVLLSSSFLITQSAAAIETEVSNEHGTFTFEFPDVEFDASGECINPSFNVDMKSFVQQGDWYVDITMRKSGQIPTGSSGRAMGTSTGPATGTIQICPNLDGTGNFIIDGVFTSFDNGPSNSNLEKTFVSSVNVKKGKSTLVLSSLKRSGSKISISGKVTGTSEKYGVVGLRGSVRIDYQLKNSTKWLSLGDTSSSQSGSYKISFTKKLPKNVLFRVKFVETDSIQASEVKKVA